jgi:hypothetical protein
VGIRPQMTKPDYVDFVRLTVTRGPAESPGAATGTEAAGGRWVLTSAAPQGGPLASSYEKPGEVWTIDSSNGRIATSYDYDGPPHRHQVGSVSWGPPPASAAPGDTWTTTLSAEVTCSSDDPGTIGGDETLDVQALWTDDSGLAQTKQWNAVASCQQGPGSADLSWGFPAPYISSGATLEIDVSGGGAKGSDTWTYSYQWQP